MLTGDDSDEGEWIDIHYHSDDSDNEEHELELESEDESDEWVELESESEVESETDTDSEAHSPKFVEDREGQEDSIDCRNDDIPLTTNRTEANQDGTIRKAKRVKFSKDVRDKPKGKLEVVKEQRHQRAADIAQSRVSICQGHCVAVTCNALYQCVSCVNFKSVDDKYFI